LHDQDSNFWTQMVRDLGFPVIVALWFMIRSDKRQDKIIELIRELIKNVKEGDKE
jgi:hypothetical protein